jgi:hypothetical protein
MPYKRNGKWYSDFRRRVAGVPTGERVRKLLPGVTKRPDAVKAEQKLAAQLSGLLDEPPPLLTDFLKTTYLTWARENKAKPEIDERYVRYFSASPHFQGRRLDQVSVIQVESYKRDRHTTKRKAGRAYKARTVENEIAVLSRAFRLAIDSGLVRANPCRLVARRGSLEPPDFVVLDRRDEPRLFAALSDGPA